jgi:hypothetical protein
MMITNAFCSQLRAVGSASLPRSSPYPVRKLAFWMREETRQQPVNPEALAHLLRYPHS